MRSKYVLIVMVALFAFACKKETVNPAPGPGPINPPPPPPPPATTIFLKDLVLSNLPSPYYHFEYDDQGRVNFVSFASNFNMYNVTYNGSKIAQMQNNIIVNKDKLQYAYDNQGRLSTVIYFDSTGGSFWKRLTFFYIGNTLGAIEWKRKQGLTLVVEKTMTFSYHPDGNVHEIFHHRPANVLLNQPETNYTETFENYDDKINVDGFMLTHNDFFDHFVLLPVKLQKNNARKTTLTGTATNYEVVYTYTYNDKNVPTHRAGAGKLTSGPNSGQSFQLSSTYTYY